MYEYLRRASRKSGKLKIGRGLSSCCIFFSIAPAVRCFLSSCTSTSLHQYLAFPWRVNRTVGLFDRVAPCNFVESTDWRCISFSQRNDDGISVHTFIFTYGVLGGIILSPYVFDTDELDWLSEYEFTGLKKDLSTRWSTCVVKTCHMNIFHRILLLGSFYVSHGRLYSRWQGPETLYFWMWRRQIMQAFFVHLSRVSRGH